MPGEAETSGDAVGILLRAITFAAHKHRDQRRKDASATPYINHPIALASLLHSEAGIDDVTVLCAAILHDTIEDTQTTATELEEQFGARIAAIVVEVTDDKSLDKATRKRLQVEHAAAISREAKLVKLADKICNLRDMSSTPPHDWAVERLSEYYDWAKRVVDAIGPTHGRLEALFEVEYGKRPWVEQPEDTLS